jgi:hypothetical protein
VRTGGKDVPEQQAASYEVRLWEPEGAGPVLGHLRLDTDHRVSVETEDAGAGDRMLLESLVEELNGDVIFELPKLPPPDAPNPGSHRFDTVTRGTPAFVERLPEVARSFFDVDVRRVA